MNIVMYGPGHGHNIEKWLKVFNEQEIYSMAFLYYGDISMFEKMYTNIIFIRISSLVLQIPTLLKVKCDLFILHGAYSIRQTIVLMHLIKAQKTVFIPWGNGILLNYDQLPFLNKLLTYLVFRKVDVVSSSPQIIDSAIKKFPHIKDKAHQMLWGINTVYFENHNCDITQYTKDVVESFKDSYVIFWPRSIFRISKFNIAIDALNLQNLF